MKNSFDYINKVILQVYNIELTKFNLNFLSKLIQSRMDETGCHSEAEYGSLLSQNELEGKKFVESLYISFSEFFRNPLTYSVLEQIILPLVILQNKNTKHNEIRIWSAASAYGQEAYSLAIILEEIKAGTNGKFNYRIFATDMSENHLLEGKRGRYTESSLNNVSLKRVSRWFDHDGDYYFVKPELKKNIHFSIFDLLNENLISPPASIFGDFDLIVCANLLFYYKPEIQKIILSKLINCMARGGYLVTGEIERDILINNQFHEIFPHSAIFKK